LCRVETAEGDRAGPGCTDLDRFEGFVWELFGAGDVVKLSKTVSTLAAIEKRKKREAAQEQTALQTKTSEGRIGKK
jgi:hypothetical protein